MALRVRLVFPVRFKRVPLVLRDKSDLRVRRAQRVLMVALLDRLVREDRLDLLVLE